MPLTPRTWPKVGELTMESTRESFNPWTVVNVVFHHLAAQGLHPTLGGADPGTPAADLLRAFGIEPAPEGDRQVGDDKGVPIAQRAGRDEEVEKR